jgi:cytochrome c peroxidase
MRAGLYLIVLLIGLLSCETETEQAWTSRKPDYFPEIPTTDVEPYTRKQWELGKKLFFDPILSRTKDISCASCHQPDLAFTDGLSVSLGVEGREGLRNAPSLFNVVYHESFFWDGGGRSLEGQALAPFSNEHEFDLPAEEAIARLKNDPDYQRDFVLAFGSPPNAYSLTRAFFIFQSGLLSFDSPFDRFYFEGDASALTERAQKGWELFKSDSLACISCHQLPFFRSEGFFHNGSYDWGELDPGRYRVSGLEADRGAFKIPSLRNAEMTAPYFHDGRVESLGEVVGHYAKGGNNFPTQDDRISGFGLSPEDSLALIDFLSSL